MKMLSAFERLDVKHCMTFFLEWVSAQSWSNGKVGMYGKSWGGFNGLQVAFRKPEALKAVISLYSTGNTITNTYWSLRCKYLQLKCLTNNL